MKYETQVHVVACFIASFLTTNTLYEVPEDWENWELPARKAYWDGKANYTGAIKPRDRVCVVEIWLEALDGISVNRIALVDKRVIRGVLNSMPEWSKNDSAMRFGKIYGVQKGYVKNQKP
jgi:hypothetical protein